MIQAGTVTDGEAGNAPSLSREDMHFALQSAGQSVALGQEVLDKETECYVGGKGDGILTYSQRLRFPEWVCFHMKGARMAAPSVREEASNWLMDKCHEKKRRPCRPRERTRRMRLFPYSKSL